MVLQGDDRRGESGREAERQPPGRGRLPPACSPSPQGEQQCEGQEVGSRAGGLRPDPRPLRPQPARPEDLSQKTLSAWWVEPEIITNNCRLDDF